MANKNIYKTFAMQVISKIEALNPKIESSIMPLFRLGDKSAFNHVYTKMYLPITNFVKTKVKHQTTTEDIVANVFAKAFQNRENIQSTQHLRRWLFFVARNESIDHLKSKIKQQEIHDYLLWNPAYDENKWERSDLEEIFLLHIEQAIDRLPCQQRMVLRLYFFEHKKTSEIGNLLQIRPQTVLNHKVRALKSLKEFASKNPMINNYRAHFGSVIFLS
jgi:RNA polymerase sigma factor (sigma-70 family)